jgi:ADP-heptose:LPS heptosyltransferase
LEVLAHAIGKDATKIPPAEDGTRAPVLRLRAPEHPDVQKRLALVHDSYVVVHPGMAGSALNWPQKNYVLLIRELTRMTKVVITGTPADEPWLTEIRSGLEGLDKVSWLVGEVTPTELLGVLNESRLVIAPSTGVAHLAASLGKPVVSFFSPLKVQSPVRWSPRSKTATVTCLVPDEPDMEKITLEDSLRAIARSLS